MLLGGGLAWPQIYRWTDPQGGVHFTDDPSRIPAAYRGQASVYQARQPDGSPAPGDGLPNAPPSTPPAAAEAPSQARQTDLLGRGPEHWQALARRWSAALAQHQAERDRLHTLSTYTRQLASATRDLRERGRLLMEAQRLERAIAEVDARIQAAHTMLHTTLPLEARRFGAHPDWLKPSGPSPSSGEAGIGHRRAPLAPGAPEH
jgi:hypothetical protein